MKQVYTTLTKSIFTLAIVLVATVSGFAGNITVSSSSTQSYTAGLNGTNITVNGTLNLNPAWSSGDAGNNTITINNGGIVNLSASALYHTYIDIKKGGVLNITVGSFAMGNGISGIINAGTINAAATNLTLDQNAALENSGTVKINNFTVNGAGSSTVKNINTGTLEIGGAFVNNAGYESTKTLKVGGNFTSNAAFKMAGTMTAGGTAVINSPMTLNGTMTVASNLTIYANVTGTNGSITVTNGTSLLSAQFAGTNMYFYDVNTASHNFDTNWSSNSSYTVGTAQAGSVLPLRFLSFDAVEYNKTSVYFRFVTTVESNLSTLQLQGSNDGKNYTTIESFVPHNMNGIFTYTSAKVEAAKYTSYRIAVINLDGNKEYSKAIFYKSSAAASTETSIYPNPVTNGTFNVKVTSAEPVIINVYSNDGKILFNTTLKGQQLYQVQMPSATAKFSLITIQVIQNGKINSFSVLNR